MAGVINMQPHQQRIVKEQEELKEKLDKLISFIGKNPLFLSLNKEEQNRLMRQKVAMNEYNEVLKERILAFY